jgi:hypothetical protein
MVKGYEHAHRLEDFNCKVFAYQLFNWRILSTIDALVMGRLPY